jgi:hypothetical protein
VTRTIELCEALEKPPDPSGAVFQSVVALYLVCRIAALAPASVSLNTLLGTNYPDPFFKTQVQCGAIAEKKIERFPRELWEDNDQWREVPCSKMPRDDDAWFAVLQHDHNVVTETIISLKKDPAAVAAGGKPRVALLLHCVEWCEYGSIVNGKNVGRRMTVVETFRHNRFAHLTAPKIWKNVKPFLAEHDLVHVLCTVSEVPESIIASAKKFEGTDEGELSFKSFEGQRFEARNNEHHVVLHEAAMSLEAVRRICPMVGISGSSARVGIAAVLAMSTKHEEPQPTE